MSVIDLRDGRELRNHTLRTSVNLVDLTPDDDYVLVSNGDQITIIETSTDNVVRSFSFGAAPVGIAVSKENAVYVLLPGSQIKLLGLSGLVHPTR